MIQIINLLVLNNFYPVIYRRIQKGEKATNYTAQSLVMVRNQLSAQVVNVLVIFSKQIEINSQRLLSSTIEIAKK